MTPDTGDTPAPDYPSSASPPVLTRITVIPNKRGLHARAAAKFVMMAERFDSSVDVLRDGQSVSARSIMGLMMLGAGPGATILVQATGKQAREALDAITTLVENGFDEDSLGPE
jgi:phosphocarrier protein